MIALHRHYRPITQLTIYLLQHIPTGIETRKGFVLLKSVLWVDGGVQLYIRFEKASPPRNGVRLHLTFLRLASLVGIGHDTTIHPFLDSASPPRNGVRLHLTFLRLASLVGIGHEGPGAG